MAWFKFPLLTAKNTSFLLTHLNHQKYFTQIDNLKTLYKN